MLLLAFLGVSRAANERVFTVALRDVLGELVAWGSMVRLLRNRDAPFQLLLSVMGIIVG